MGFFFGLLSLVILVAWMLAHPQSFFGLIALVAVTAGVGYHYYSVKQEAEEQRYARDEREEYSFYTTQEVRVDFAGVAGGCFIDKPWKVETTNTQSMKRDIQKLKVSVTFHRPNYADPLQGLSSTVNMAANEALCIAGPSWDVYPAVRVQALAGKPYGEIVAKFIDTFEKPVPMKVGETRTMRDGSIVKRID